MKRARAELRRLEAAGIRIPFFAGAELSLAEFLDEDPLAAEAIAGEPRDGRKDGAQLQLSLFLGAQGPDERLFRAGTFLERLLRHETLTCEPFLRELSGLEHAGTFHKGYRDHVTHSVLVYLLGAYLVRKNRQLGKALRADKAHTFRAFAGMWRTCALFHDVGYLFETDDRTTHESALQLLRAYPKKVLERLRQIAPANCRGLSDGEVNGIATKFETATPFLRDVFDLFLPPRKGRALADAFAILDRNPERPRQGLTGGFRGHFDLCRTTPSNRPPFLDHGIMSALLLLKLGEIEAIALDVISNELSDEDGWPEFLSKRMKKAEAVKHEIERAATAIAVHNINPNQHYEHGEPRPAGAKVLDRRRYQVRLDENPLSFLLRVSDSLQDWDRRLFRSSYKDPNLPRPRSKQDIAIDVGPDEIEVRVCSVRPEDTKEFVASMSDLYLSDGQRVDQPDSWLRVRHVDIVPARVMTIAGVVDDAQAAEIRARIDAGAADADPDVRAAARKISALPQRQDGISLRSTQFDLTAAVVDLVEVGYGIAEAEEKIRSFCASLGLEDLRT